MPINYALKRCNCMYWFGEKIKSTHLLRLNCVINHIPNTKKQNHIKNGGKPAATMRFLQKSIAPQWKTWFTTQVYHLFWFILSKSQIRHRFTTYIHSECRLYLILVTQTGRFITFKTNFCRQYFAQLKQSFRAADPLRGTIVSIEQNIDDKN